MSLSVGLLYQYPRRKDSHSVLFHGAADGMWPIIIQDGGNEDINRGKEDGSAYY